MESTQKKSPLIPYILIPNILRYAFPVKELFIYRVLSKTMHEKICQCLRIYIKDSSVGEEVKYAISKTFLVTDQECSDYFKKKILPFLADADTLYEFLSAENEKIFTDALAFFYDELKKKKYPNEIAIPAKEEKEFKNRFIYHQKRFITQYIIGNLTKNEIEELDFNSLAPSKEAIPILRTLILKMKNFTYLDLSCSAMTDKMLRDILKAVEEREWEFEIVLKGVELSNSMIKVVNSIQNTEYDKKIVIDEKYKGIQKQILCKMCNIKQGKNRRKVGNP